MQVIILVNPTGFLRRGAESGLHPLSRQKIIDLMESVKTAAFRQPEIRKIDGKDPAGQSFQTKCQFLDLPQMNHLCNITCRLLG